MSDDDEFHSPFWPLVIVFVGILLWNAFQYYQLITERSLLVQQTDSLAPAVTQAQGAQTRLVSFVTDLLQTSAKDPAAAKIVTDAKNAGFLTVNSGADTNSASSELPPPPDSAK
jgi:hypothetical protein